MNFVQKTDNFAQEVVLHLPETDIVHITDEDD